MIGPMTTHSLPQDLTPEIADVASGAKSVTFDGVHSEAQPIADLIKADCYLKGQQAVAAGRPGFRVQKLIAPGAVDGPPRRGY